MELILLYRVEKRRGHSRKFLWTVPKIPLRRIFPCPRTWVKNIFRNSLHVSFLKPQVYPISIIFQCFHCGLINWELFDFFQREIIPLGVFLKEIVVAIHHLLGGHINRTECAAFGGIAMWNVDAIGPTAWTLMMRFGKISHLGLLDGLFCYWKFFALRKFSFDCFTCMKRLVNYNFNY